MLHLDLTDLIRLREVLSQSAVPGSWQVSIIRRIDAAIEERSRPRYGERVLREPGAVTSA